MEKIKAIEDKPQKGLALSDPDTGNFFQIASHDNALLIKLSLWQRGLSSANICVNDSDLQ